MGNVLDGVYWESSWPLSLKQLIDDALGRQLDDPNMPTITTDPGTRFWFSQPRANSDSTTEVLTVTFKVPLSLSEVGFEALRVAVRIEVWYQDTHNNWRQALDRNGIPVTITLQPSARASWYKFHTSVYPLVAKAVQLRCTRVANVAAGTDPYMIGLRNTLLRRNIYQRNDGLLPIEDEMDALGNVITRYIKDWGADRAIDNSATTFWRSAPQPDHQAVVSMYLDTRAPDGSPQGVDSIVMDPVYCGQNLNIYYSNDETVGVRRLSAITQVADLDENTDWKSGRGRKDVAVEEETSLYRFPFQIGHLVSQDTWIGIEWSPDFPAENGPPNNPVLLGVTPVDPDPAQWWPTITYDSGAAGVVLSFTNGSDTVSYPAVCSPLFATGATLRIVVGWAYNPMTVFLCIQTSTGVELARSETTVTDLPTQVTMDGSISLQDFHGTFGSHVVKLENYYDGPAEAYLANPGVYTTPDPVIADAAGNIPSTTLDNAVYAVNWLLQEHGTGGAHDSFYEYKTWTPIWQDYFTIKGRLAFPHSLSMRYLKLEFSNLNEEPYPVYDSGIETTYKVYPISVQQSASTVHPGIAGTWLGVVGWWGSLALGAVGLSSVNWLNPSTVAAAADALFGTTSGPITVTTGAAQTYNSTLPSSVASSADSSVRTEAANPYIYKRTTLDPNAMASHFLVKLAAGWVGSLAYSLGMFYYSLLESFTPVINYLTQPLALPVQGQDWWVFPGGNLAMPGPIMRGLTAATQVVLGRKATTENRLRFNTTSVHRYDTKTVTRDAAIAYFAGVREVRALTTSYVDEQDPEIFSFDFYSPNDWYFTNIRALETGPVTTAGDLFVINNPNFDLSDANWILGPDQGWARDPGKGRWHWGSLTVEADGTEKNARSSQITVTEGDVITFSCWVYWENLVVADDHVGITLGGTTYLDGEPVADIVFDEVVYSDWSHHPHSWDITDPDAVILEDHGTGIFEVYSGEEHFDFDQPSGMITPDEGSHLIPDDSGMFLYQDVDPHRDWIRLTGTWICPAGVDRLRVRLSVTEDASAGQVWFDTVTLDSGGSMLGTVYKEMTTTSEFAKVRCDFRDSGTVRSNPMWVRIDPLATGIDNLALAYYVSPIPESVAGATWADSFATWSSTTATWGAERAQVAVSIDPNRLFDGRRVLKVSRVAGAGEGGVKVLQQLNIVGGALTRCCVVFYKPNANTNSLILRLRRENDGVYIHEEIIPAPTVGYWYTYQGQWFDIPEGDDQAYTIEVVSAGDAEDEVYINDLYMDIALGRYFIQLGGVEQPLQEVTALRYASGYAQVVTSDPVTTMSVQVAVLSPRFYLFGASIAPVYLD